MSIVTNYYSSQFTRVIYNSMQKVRSGKANSPQHRSALLLQAAESKSMALNLLLGKKSKVNHKMKQPNHLEGLYNNYSAKGEYVEVKHWHEEITVDNSGPCTLNSSLDSSINVEDYIKRAQKQNEESVKNAGNLFSWNNRDVYTSISTVYNKVLNDKYSFLHNEALKHADSKQYIYDKYNNPESPFYASDLTNSQRKLAYIQERDMLKSGSLNGAYFQDSLFGDTSIFGAASDADEKIFNRRMINQQLSNMLSGAGVTIPSDANLTCSVDFTTCYISVTDNTGDGNNRSDLTKQIEDILNKENNGMELYMHIMSSSSSMYRNESSQFNYEGWYKFLYLHNVEGSSYGMDEDYNKKFADWCAKYYPGQYADKAKEVGFDGFNNMDLKIGLSSIGFYDVCQDVNWSNPTNDTKISEWYSKTEYSVLAGIENTRHDRLSSFSK